MKPEEVASLIERLEIIDKESIDRPDLRTIDVDVVAREAIAHIASLEAKLKTAQSWDDIESGANEKLQATIKAQHLAVISLRERNTELLTYCESLDDHEATLQATIDELNKYKSRCNTDYRSYAETLEGKVKTLQATITSQEASIELLETDKRCKRIIIDRATETIRKERATITEQAGYIKFIEAALSLRPHDMEAARAEFAALKEKAKAAMYDESNTWEPPEEQGRDQGVPIEQDAYLASLKEKIDE